MTNNIITVKNNNNDNNENKKFRNTDNSSPLQSRIFEMNELFHRLMDCDEDRTGKINMNLFENIVFYLNRIACNYFSTRYILPSDDISVLIKEIKMRYRCGENSDQISYIAVWGTLLAFLIQNNGFEDFPNFGIWTKKNAPFICLEPWLGYSDTIETSGNIMVKEGMQTIEAYTSKVYNYCIEIL